MGADVSEYTGSFKEWNSLTHPDDSKIVYGALEGIAQGVNEFDIKYRMILPLGLLVHVWVKGVVERDEKGRSTRVIGTTQNTTEEKSKERQLKESEILYRSIWENTLDGIILGKPDGRLIAANPAACAML